MPTQAMRMDTTTMRIMITDIIMTMVPITMIIRAMIITLTTTTLTIMPRMIMATITTTSIATIPTITTATSMLMTTSEPVAACDLAEREAAALYRLMTWLSPAFPVGVWPSASVSE